MGSILGREGPPGESRAPPQYLAWEVPRTKGAPERATVRGLQELDTTGDCIQFHFQMLFRAQRSNFNRKRKAKKAAN